MTDADVIAIYLRIEQRENQRMAGAKPHAIAEMIAHQTFGRLTARDVLQLVNDDQIMGPS